VPSNLTAPARQALALPDAQHRTWSVTRYSVAEIAQATPHARLRTSSDHQQSARILREASVNMSRIGPMAMLTRAWEIAALCNSSMPRLAASFFADCRRSSKSNSIGRSEPLAGITSTSVRSACTAFAAWLANRRTLRRIRVQTNGADPFPMFDRTGLNRLRVLRGQYRTISFVQYLRCCGTKQRPAEETSVCGHDVEIESVCVGEL